MLPHISHVGVIFSIFIARCYCSIRGSDNESDPDRPDAGVICSPQCVRNLKSVEKAVPQGESSCVYNMVLIVNLAGRVCGQVRKKELDNSS